jgi:hypothetical protein
VAELSAHTKEVDGKGIQFYLRRIEDLPAFHQTTALTILRLLPWVSHAADPRSLKFLSAGCPWASLEVIRLQPLPQELVELFRLLHVHHVSSRELLDLRSLHRGRYMLHRCDCIRLVVDTIRHS